MEKNHRRLLLEATGQLPTEGKLPKRMRVLPWGDNPSAKYGPIRVNNRTAAILPKAQKMARRDGVHVDFSHNSVVGGPTYRGEPLHLAARRSRVEVVPGDGIYLDDIEWNPTAEEHKLDYPEISAVPVVDKDGTVLCLESVAICRHGELDGMALPLSAEVVTVVIVDDDDNETLNNEDIMDCKKLLLILLGLPETATDDEIQKAATAAAKKLGVKPASAQDRIAAVAPAQPDTTAATATPLSADAIGNVVASGIKPIADRLDTIERNNIAALAIRDGKLIPLHADKLGLEDFRSLVAGLKAGEVPLDQRTPEKVAALASTGLVALSGDDSKSVSDSVCKQLGIKRGDFDKA